MPRPFPQQQLAFFDATTVHPDARAFQLAVFVSQGPRAVFCPYGPPDTPLSIVLAYRTTQPFSSASSYEAGDMRNLVGDQSAQGPAGGFLNADGNWVYFPPFRKDVGQGIQPNSLVVRWTPTKELLDQTAWQKFDVQTLSPPPPRFGWATGASTGTAAFFIPVTEVGSGPGGTALPHGILLRYNETMPFATAASWSWLNLAQLNAQLRGFQSNAIVGNWLYIIPFFSNVFARYDLTKPFALENFEVFDLSSISTAHGFTGGIRVGPYVLFVPWRDWTLDDLPASSMSVAALHDSRLPLTQQNAWAFFDLRTVHPDAAGFEFGWNDYRGFVHLVPAANAGIQPLGTPPPFVVWDALEPFAAVSSWTSYTSTGVTNSTGAAYNGFRRSWLAPYGYQVYNGLITQVTTD